MARGKSEGELHPTAAGLLMFDEEYLIVREFPEYFLDYREILDPSIRWTDRFQSSSGDWSGNLFEFYFRVYNKLIKDIKVPFRLEGGNRIDDTSVHQAVREVLANCLINTDYYGSRGIVIKKEQDCIIMENPGDIRTGKDQMLKGGIPDIYDTWENEDWKEPIIEEQYEPNRTILTLPFIKKEIKKATIKSDDKKAKIKITKKTEEQSEKILKFMQTDQEYILADFCELLGLKETRTKEILKLLFLNDKIEMIGSNRDRRYKLMDAQSTRK